jgi:peptidoglycan/xylan/chitin deacetylase (PgdA/CDA1 family)
MKLYKFPKLLRFLYPGAIWDFPSSPDIFLTFDDGPDPTTTPDILEILKQEDVKATFFCLGEQVAKYPELFQEIKGAGHAIGNHSMTHPLGFKTSNEAYVNDVLEASEYIESKMFRAPYGKMKPSQHRLLVKEGFTTFFWTIVSYDFDQPLPPKKYVSKMLGYAKQGAMYVFHDNPKAKEQTKNELPKIIRGLKEKGYSFEKIKPELFS